MLFTAYELKEKTIEKQERRLRKGKKGARRYTALSEHTASFKVYQIPFKDIIISFFV